MLPSGESVVTISLATSNVWKDKNTGERKENTEWHRIILFRGLANIAAQYLNKGRQVYIEGHIKSHRYTDREGIERTSYDIIADQIIMLGNRPEHTKGEGRGKIEEYARVSGSFLRSDPPFF